MLNRLEAALESIALALWTLVFQGWLAALLLFLIFVALVWRRKR